MSETNSLESAAIACETQGSTLESIKVYDATEVARLLGISIGSVRNRVRDGSLPHHAVGPRRQIFTESDIKAYLAKTARNGAL